MIIKADNTLRTGLLQCYAARVLHDRKKIKKEGRAAFYEKTLGDSKFLAKYTELLPSTMRHGRVKKAVVSSVKLMETRLNVEESDPTSKIVQKIMSRISRGRHTDTTVLAAALTQKLNGRAFLTALEKKNFTTFSDLIKAAGKIIKAKTVTKYTSEFFNRRMYTRCENQQHLTAEKAVRKLATTSALWKKRRKNGTMYSANRRGYMVALVKTVGKLTAKNTCSVAMDCLPRTFGIERGKDGRVGAMRALDLANKPSSDDAKPSDRKKFRLKERGTLMGPGAMAGWRCLYDNGMVGLISDSQPCVDGLVLEIEESKNKVFTIF